MLKLRDRDAIIANDGIIFRVYGYIHPEDSYICDPEYAIPEVFLSLNSRAHRGENELHYCKFFEDEGMKLILNDYPKYSIFFLPLQKCLVGVKHADIMEVRKPDIELKHLLEKKPDNTLLEAMQSLINLLTSKSKLSIESFGVFGSLLHSFYHPKFSDLDFIIYGRNNLKALLKVLQDLYDERSFLQNEFVNRNSVIGKNWKFVNYTLDEYVWHQQRKFVYAYYNCEDAGRIIKTEFEPVKNWQEISNDYNPFTRISYVGWIKAIVEIINDDDAPFIPSIYTIEVKEILDGPKIDDIQRIISYIEEFRMQAKKGEEVLVEGNLERIVNGTNNFHQITLSYGSRYYDQTFKVIKNVQKKSK